MRLLHASLIDIIIQLLSVQLLLIMMQMLLSDTNHTGFCLKIACLTLTFAKYCFTSNTVDAFSPKFSKTHILS